MNKRRVRRRPRTAADLLHLAGLNLVEPRELARRPDPELRLIVAALMELLEARRDQLDQHGGALRVHYERFRGALEESSFAINTTAERKARAEDQRRLGEHAERRGNVDGAIAFYKLALRSWPEIGCRRRLEWLLRHEVRDADRSTPANRMVRNPR